MAEKSGGSACGKYLDRIDNFCKRAYRYSYTTTKTDLRISALIEKKDQLLFNKIMTTENHHLHDLLPPKRTRTLGKRRHEFRLPQIKTERFKKFYEQMYFWIYIITFSYSIVQIIFIYCSLIVKTHVWWVYLFLITTTFKLTHPSQSRRNSCL